MIRFPYKSFLVRGTRAGFYGTVFRPVIALRVFGSAGEFETTGLVDTGADDTLFPDQLIDKLGVVIKPGEHSIIVGIDGGMTVVRYGMVDLAIPGSGGGYRWSAQVGFHAGEKVVFGHNGFLEYFTASFNGRTRQLTLTPNGKAGPSVHP